MLLASVLALTVSAAPPTTKEIKQEKRALASSNSQNGSIYRFGDAKECSKILRDYGACGISTYFKNVNQGASFVAMPSGVFDKYGASQNNKLCGKTITMTYKGVTRKAIVADRNVSKDNSIDMCLDIWQAFGGRDNDGTLRKEIKWTIN
ncbi:hypothetical protein NQ176_g5261 [Zarea fungicola]|uniref:Uncharacterized protein n=1 Tax=Zarea fungicola TaxID=93591 RepID=A0ACC1NAH6_9HYPO|nr:hypothetical protein NQ176_g5261 [Lecanicillium fungicola]